MNTAYLVQDNSYSATYKKQTLQKLEIVADMVHVLVSVCLLYLSEGFLKYKMWNISPLPQTVTYR